MKLVGLVGVIALAVIGSAAVWTLLSGKQSVARGPVTSSGSGSAYPKSGDRLRFAEEKDWLGEAGLNDAKRYASFARPNIGVSESRLGMSHLEFRNRIERRMYEEVLKEDPKVFLDRIKKEKFGVDSSGQGAPVEAVWTQAGLTPSQRSKKYVKDHPESLKKAMAEVDRLIKLGGKINVVVADHILALAKKVVSQNGNPNNKLQVAKAYIVGWHHFLANGNAIEYEAMVHTLGPIKPHDRIGKVIFKEGVLGLDRPRGVCNDFTTSLMAGLSQKCTQLGFAVFVVEVSSRNGQTDHRFNHDLVGIRFAESAIEGYDPTQNRMVVSSDVDAIAEWATRYHGRSLTEGVRSSFLPGANARASSVDPFSTLNKDAFLGVPLDLATRIERAVP